MLSRVTSATDDHLSVARPMSHEGHVFELGRQIECGENCRGVGALNGEHSVVTMKVRDRDVGRRHRSQCVYHLRSIGRVRNEEHIVDTVEVGDEIVDYSPGFIAQQRVLRLTGTDSAELIGQNRIEEVCSTWANHSGLT